jgi:hypothetical protein
MLPDEIIEAGAATETDIRVGRGETPRTRLQFRNKDTRAIIPTTGITACSLVVYDATGEAPLFTIAGVVVTPASTGQLTFDWSAANTNALPPPAEADDTDQSSHTARYAISVSDGTLTRVVARGRILVLSELDA